MDKLNNKTIAEIKAVVCNHTTNLLAQSKLSVVFTLLFFMSALVYAKNKIYLADNTASVAIVPTAESSFNLEITLKPKDNFATWSLGFFMLRVFLDPARVPFTAKICKQSLCTTLILDVVNPPMANNQIDYLKPKVL